MKKSLKEIEKEIRQDIKNHSPTSKPKRMNEAPTSDTTQQIKVIKCIYCSHAIRSQNKSGICSNCQNINKWKNEYMKLKQESEKRYKLYEITLKSYLEEIKRLNPNYFSEEEDLK